MAPSFVNIPDEILRLILQNFCLHCTREHGYDAIDGYYASRNGDSQDPKSPSWYSPEYSRVLHSMCLASRRFVSVAQAYLHHAFLLGYGDSWRSNGFSWDRRLCAFLRTMARRRDLALLVKRIFVHPYLISCIKVEEARSALEDAAHVLESRDVAHYIASFQELVMRNGYAQPDGLSLLGLLLALASNLERLSLQVLEFTGGIPGTAFGILATEIPGQRPLSKLTTLDICNHSEGMILFDLDHHASGILDTASVNLQTLNLHMCGAAGLRIGENKLHLRHLHVTQSCLGDAGLEMLLSVCAPGLESFVYEASYPFLFPSCGYESNYGANGHPACQRQPIDNLWRHLFKFRTTLKSLNFDLRGRQGSFPMWAGGRTEPLTGKETLKDFEVLENVFISASSICSPWGILMSGTPGTDLLTKLLPANIKTVQLVGERLDGLAEWLASALQHLAEAVSDNDSHFGALERVSCDKSMAQEVDETAAPELFALAGVESGYESWDLSDPTVEKGAFGIGTRDYTREHSTDFPCVPLPLPFEGESDGEL